ncbi:hypothetical protein ACGFIF_38020 [Kribbella sp. NPDC049174]|uniref:hypothetical protein n=1 Tax=Kribbella sp. NPDC049174 TaxID=3364112 RepID=UPI0037134B0D
MPHATDLVLNIQFSHYFIAGMVLYLIHAHIGFIVFERLGDQVNHVLLVAATMIAMVAAAAALHRWVERPLAPLLKQVLSGKRQLAPTK